MGTCVWGCVIKRIVHKRSHYLYRNLYLILSKWLEWISISKEVFFVCSVDFELLSSSLDVESNPQMKAELEKLRKLTEQVKDNNADSVSLLSVCTEYCYNKW